MEKKILLRIIKPKVHDQLVKLAKENHQSVNGLINSILEETLHKHKKHLVISK